MRRARSRSQVSRAPYYEVPPLRALRVVRPLSLIGLSPVRPLAVVYPASNGIMGKDRCPFRSSASWIVGVLQQLAHCALNPQLISELVQTGRQSDVTEKQSQRLECHFGVTGMILFATRYHQPAGGWKAPSVQPNPSEL